MAATRTTKPRQRGQLSREAIIEATLRLTSGGEQVTFRALGTLLGADPTAVYRHFRDKDELLRAAYDQMLLDSRAQVDDSAPWRDQLRQLAMMSWEATERHPHIVADAPMLTTSGPGELACLDLMLRLLREAGLAPADVVRFYGVLASYILAVSANMSAQKLAEQALGADAKSTWLYDVRAIDAERYPDVAANRHALSDLSNDDIYLTGIEVLLDAVEAAAAANPR